MFFTAASERCALLKWRDDPICSLKSDFGDVKKWGGCWSLSLILNSMPVAIAETAGQMARQGAMPFVALIAGLSTAVGLMNLFPIPVLDGGHLLFCAYEAITGRKPSDSALQILMTIGLFLVLSLTAFAVVMNFMCP
jgi:regulator of sigma E protease